MNLSKEEKEKKFIMSAKLKHNNKYDYSKVDYKATHTKVCIICPEHGEFWQEPSSHLSGCGCPKCGRLRTLNARTDDTLTFINKSIKIHGNYYDYSLTSYINNSTNVCIICPEHGEFWQTPRSHLQGKGCPSCGKKKISNKRKSTTKLFIERANKVHNYFYNYDNVRYVNCYESVCITCPEHGEFWQKPTCHLSGRGCPKCGREKTTEKQTMPIEEFIQKAQNIHNDKYNYSKVVYKGSKTKVCIICPEHGEFWQTPDSHLNGSGCPKCNIIVSKAEDEITKLLNPLECERGNRKILGGKEIDIYVPSLKVGIEYNGLMWHSEAYGKNKRYHINKLEECHRQGINLIQIFEDEWITHKDFCKNKLIEICNPHTLQVINSEDYEIRNATDKQEINNFIEKYDIQENVKFSVCLGAYYNNELIGLIAFKRMKHDIWKINTIVSKFGVYIIKFKENVINYFITHYDPTSLSITIDRRWGDDNNIYENIGFKLISIIKPKCFYHNKKEKYKRYKEAPLNGMTYSKIWDCGYLKFTYNKKIKQ